MGHWDYIGITVYDHAVCDVQWRCIGVPVAGTASSVAAYVTVCLDRMSVSLSTVAVLTVSVNLVGPGLRSVRLVGTGCCYCTGFPFSAS